MIIEVQNTLMKSKNPNYNSKLKHFPTMYITNTPLANQSRPPLYKYIDALFTLVSSSVCIHTQYMYIYTYGYIHTHTYTRTCIYLHTSDGTINRNRESENRLLFLESESGK